MIEYNSITDKLSSPCAVALGYFNGVHLGHRSVISAAVQAARAEGLLSCVFTFEVLSPEAPISKRGRPLLMTAEGKRAAVDALGADVEYSLPFASFASMTAESFFREVLLERLGARIIACGGDYRFGAGAAGDVKLLDALCAASGVRLIVVPPKLMDAETISSTRIVSAVEAGELAAAAEMLGAPLTLTGEAQPCAAPASQSACRCCGDSVHPAADDPAVREFLRHKAAAAFSTVYIDAPQRFVRPPCGVYLAYAAGRESAAALYPVGDTLRWEAPSAQGLSSISLLALHKPMRDYDSPETLRAAMFALAYGR